MVNIAVSGFCGRMGNRIANLLFEDNETDIVGGIERKECLLIDKDIGLILKKDKLDILLTSDVNKAIDSADVLIDFSTTEATMHNLHKCRKKGINMVIGTTGLSVENLNEIKKISKDIAIVQSYNMSIGVNLLFGLVENLTKKVFKDSDIEIIEAHHKFKEDAPSGTAKTIANIISKIKGKNPQEITVCGREGHTGARSGEEIGIHAIRASDIVGEHTVIFGLDGERIELVHKAHTRDIFAFGAIMAAKFLKNKSSGLYNMQDVLEKRKD